MDDIGVVMTPFGDVVTVILMVNSYVFGFYANIWCHRGMLKIVFIIHRTMSHA